MVVDAGGIRRQRAPGPLQTHPQDEVDVLPVGEQVLVKAPRGEERRPVEGRRRAGRPDRVGYAVFQTCHRLAIQVVEDEQRSVELHPRGVDSGWVVRFAHHPRRHRHAGGRIEWRHDRLDVASVAPAG
ncbi:MAG: hypothetical protein AUG48_06880 [Actinobacteria bacterium 13_1_20CM_3_68_9]|nr:MAG: hypothetical protein AUG48_06880 [Actinobacteria bacterium 13_1_20CM_3_68_9]